MLNIIAAQTGLKPATYPDARFYYRVLGFQCSCGVAYKLHVPRNILVGYIEPHLRRARDICRMSHPVHPPTFEITFDAALYQPYNVNVV